MVLPFAFEMLALLLDCSGSFLVAIVVMTAKVKEEEETQRWCLLGEFEEWIKMLRVKVRVYSCYRQALQR